MCSRSAALAPAPHRTAATPRQKIRRPVGQRSSTGVSRVRGVSRVLPRQPLGDMRGEQADRGRGEQGALVPVLAEGGVGVGGPRRILAARQRAERVEAVRAASRPTNISFLVPVHGSAEDPVALSELATLDEAAMSAPELTETSAFNMRAPLSMTAGHFGQHLDVITQSHT